MRGKVLEDAKCKNYYRITPAYAGKSSKKANCSYSVYRITPAYAGKRAFLYSVVRRSWDHPRLCGEKRCLFWCSQRLEGSPPPMRGKATENAQHVISKGITPAYAGKRFSDCLRRIPQKDHPRLCGEKPTAITHARAMPGSPPPMRGKVRAVLNPDETYRITPAYAGKRKFRPAHRLCW